jgi:hypothetical protein
MTITEVDLDVGGNLVVFAPLSPISIGILSPQGWGLTQDGQAYFNRDGPAPGENARLVQDGLGGLVMESVTSWAPT